MNDYWLISGITLMLLELILPGGVVIFLGISALLISAMIKMGVELSLAEWLTIWIIISLFNLIVMRSFFMKFFSGGSFKENTDEDEALIGKVVSVHEDIFPYSPGRIRMQDTFWDAQSEEELLKGSQAVVLGRKDNTIIVSGLKEV